MAEWALLPTPLVDFVAGFLNMADQARMAAVCKPWHEAMADGLCRRRPAPSIWVLPRQPSIPSFHPHCSEVKNHDDHCAFLSFSEGLKRRYFFTLPGATNRSERAVIIGSSNGWLMLEDEAAGLRAFQPLTKARLLFHPSTWDYRHNFDAIAKAVFVPPKASRGGSDPPVVVAILRRRIGGGSFASELAFAVAGDGAWMDLPAPEGTHFCDIAAHDGKLYALAAMGQVLVFDLGGEKPFFSSSPATVRAIRDEGTFGPIGQKRIGLISGELILVRLWTGTRWPFQGPCQSKFEVFRLQNETEWVKTRDLAGHAILHAHDGIIALPVGEYGELEADCIYSLQNRLTVTNIASGAVTSKRLSIPSSCSRSWFLPARGS